MTPSESAILENYLLRPARLQDAVTLEQFRSFFPRSQRSSPHIKTLFRDLQHQRNVTFDRVSENIEHEARKGKAQKREVARLRREDGLEEYDEEVEIERVLYGHTSDGPPRRHTLVSVIPAMDDATKAMELEVAQLEEAEAALSESLKHTIGRLSDLRYGRLENSSLRDEALQSLEAFQDTCHNKA